MSHIEIQEHSIMSIQHQYPNVHWLWKGGISFVYEVHPHIVVKVPKTGELERQQFQKELKIQEIFSRHPPCPSIVQCFLYTKNGIFLEYMRDMSLCSRLQNNQIRDQKTKIVTRVEKLEPLVLRKEWMHDLAQACAFLESLDLAHGDLRPENILLDRNRLKLSDFDCTAETGSDFEACMAPYGRILNDGETNQEQRGTPGLLGSRTEQFALGSLYYLINYGFEVYADRCLTEDPRDHGCKVVDLLQDMQFPKLDGDEFIDEIIDKCWHDKYSKIAELAKCTEELHLGKTDGKESSDVCALVPCRNGETANINKLDNGEPGSRTDMDQDDSLKDLSLKRAYCQDLVEHGLLDKLSSGEPEQLGFVLKWYQHCC